MSLIRYQPNEVAAWSPVDRLAVLRDEMNRLFDFPGGSRDTGLFGGWTPALDVIDEKDHFLVLCELPGMRKEDISITLHEGTITIAGERKSAQEQQESETFRSERYFGKFQRSVTLPASVDSTQVNATYVDGVLCIKLPKSEEAKQKQIQVNVG